MGPQDPAGAGRDRLRASHADREQVIEALKTAFVDGRLTKSELAARTGRALTARTYADLASLTADLPVESAAAELPLAVPAPAKPAAAEPPLAVPAPARPAASGPAHPPAPVIRRPLVGAVAVSIPGLVIAAAAMLLSHHHDPVSGSGHPWAMGFFLLTVFAVITGLCALRLGHKAPGGARPTSGAA
jgi:Domain of unknown function (DUF1707)